jgi:hypothetical protein
MLIHLIYEVYPNCISLGKEAKKETDVEKSFIHFIYLDTKNNAFSIQMIDA